MKMNLEAFNKMCVTEINKRIGIKRQRGLSWGESDDKRFMTWFSKNAGMIGLDAETISNKFFLFMIAHSPM